MCEWGALTVLLFLMLLFIPGRTLHSPFRMGEEEIRHEGVTGKQECIRSAGLELSVTGGLLEVREAF